MNKMIIKTKWLLEDIAHLKSRVKCMDTFLTQYELF